MNNVWFTADTHFSHRRIAGYEDRPFNSSEVMNRAIIQNWNEVVGPRELVFHLGDFAFCSQAKIIRLLEQLNGHIHLVRGNHDKNFGTEAQKRVIWTRDYYEAKFGGKTLVMFHYPLYIWNKRHHGSYHLHGHSHGNLNFPHPNSCIMDVGIDAARKYPWCGIMRPLHLDEIMNYMDRRENYFSADHHDLLERASR